MHYRVETSFLYPWAYRVVDTQKAWTDPRRIIADNVSYKRALEIIEEERAA